MGNCTSTPPAEHQIDLLPSQQSSENKHKLANKHDKFAEKVLSSKGALNVPESLAKWFPKQHGHKKVRKLFTLSQIIGDGVTGTVYSANYKGRNCAIKTINRDDDTLATMLFATEARVLTHVKHPNIIELIDIYFDRSNFYLIMERAHCDLYELLQDQDSLTEKHASEIAKKLLLAIKYLHDKNVSHRDLKPENIVFNKSNLQMPKLVDFGDVDFVKDDKNYDEIVGTPSYMAPERLQEYKGWQLKKSDIWAIGAICYEMIAGRRCFNGRSQNEIYDKIRNQEWKWPESLNVSNECNEFIRWCLEKDAAKRPSAENALKHPWITGTKLQTNDDEVCLYPQTWSRTYGSETMEISSAVQSGTGSTLAIYGTNDSGSASISKISDFSTNIASTANLSNIYEDNESSCDRCE